MAGIDLRRRGGPGGTSGPALSDEDPLEAGETADPGASADASRSDHRHPENGTSLVVEELDATYITDDHALLTMMSGTFTPTRSEAMVEVSFSGEQIGVAHLSAFFAWNQTVTPGDPLTTRQGRLTGMYVAGTSDITLGPAASMGNIGSTGRRFRITGLTPGTPVTWEVVVGATGYYGKIAVGGALPVDLALSADKRRLFVSSYWGNLVAVFDPAQSWDDDAMVVLRDTLTGHTNAAGVVAHPTNTNLLYIGKLSNNVVEVNLTTKAVVRTFTITAPSFVAINAAGTELYAVREAAGTVVPVNLTTGTVGTAITVGAAPGKPVRIGGYLYVPCKTPNRIDRIDLSTKAVTSLALGAGSGPIAVAANGAGTKLWVLEETAQRAREVDVATFALTGTAITGLGSSPVSLVVSETGRSLIVTANVATNMAWQSYVIPPTGTSSAVRYEQTGITATDGVTADTLSRIIEGPEGTLYALGAGDALHYWHGCRFEADPTDGFTGAFGQVLVEPAT